MKTLKRNHQTLYYSLYQGFTEVVDSNGYYTGEKIVSYSPPVKMRANISPVKGDSTIQLFGNLEDYDRVIVTCKMDCPIDENSILWIEKTPPVRDGVMIPEDYDYIVQRVSKSLNSISIAIGKVNVQNS